MVESTSSWGRNSWWSWTRPPEVAPLTAPPPHLHPTLLLCRWDTRNQIQPNALGEGFLPAPSPPVHPPLAFLGLFLPQSRPLPQAASPLRRRLGGRSLPPHLVLIRLNVLESRGRGTGVGPIHGGVCSLHPPKEEKAPQRDPPGRERAVQLPLGRLRTHGAVPSPLSSAR